MLKGFIYAAAAGGIIGGVWLYKVSPIKFRFHRVSFNYKKDKVSLCRQGRLTLSWMSGTPPEVENDDTGLETFMRESYSEQVEKDIVFFTTIKEKN